MATEKLMPPWTTETLAAFEVLTDKYHLAKLGRSASGAMESDIFSFGGPRREFVITREVIDGGGRVPDTITVSASVVFKGSREERPASVTFGRRQDAVWFACCELKETPSLPIMQEAAELARLLRLQPDEVDVRLASQVGFASDKKVMFRDSENIMFMLEQAIHITCLRTEIERIAHEVSPTAKQ